MKVENDASEFTDERKTNFQVQEMNREALARASRLKQAVNAAGGPGHVSATSGVPLSTLQGYLRGGDAKISNLVGLARACGVNIAWLSTGEGPMVGYTVPAEPKPQISAPNLPTPMINADRMVAAVEGAMAAFKARGSTPSPRQLVQIALAIYNSSDMTDD